MESSGWEIRTGQDRTDRTISSVVNQSVRSSQDTKGAEAEQSRAEMIVVFRSGRKGSQSKPRPRSTSI